MINKIYVAALAAVLSAGLAGCAERHPYYSDTGTTPAPGPVVTTPSQPQIIEGQMIRNDGDAYVIRDMSGHDTRVLLDRNTLSDPVTVGDRVVAKFDRPDSRYASSVTRRTIEPAIAPAITPVSPVLPRPRTVEGTVLRLEGNDYVVKDISGKEVRLHADSTTKMDGNITAGDRIMATTSAIPGDAPYATNVYKFGSPNVIQGDVVRVDGNGYVVRDLNGREMRINTDSTTMRDGNIVVGDRIVAYTGPGSTFHADSIGKR